MKTIEKRHPAFYSCRHRSLRWRFFCGPSQSLGLMESLEDALSPKLFMFRAWRVRNSVGRRNLHPDQMSLLRGRIYNRSKKAVGAPSGNKNRVVQRGQNDPIEKTAEKVAAKLGVLSENDNTPEPKHNTQKEIAKAANTSTGMVGMAKSATRWKSFRSNGHWGQYF